MSTRSVKAIFDPETRMAIMSYTHSNGYPESMGKMLTTYYNDEEKARRLISMGDASSIGPFIDPQEAETLKERTKTSPFDIVLDGVSVFYGRDRGENNVAHKTLYKTTVNDIFYYARRTYHGIEYVWVGIIADYGNVIWYYADTRDRKPIWYRIGKKRKPGPLKKARKEEPFNYFDTIY